MTSQPIPSMDPARRVSLFSDTRRRAPRLRPAIGLAEGAAIDLAGLRDRGRCRTVPDGLPTHWLLGLQARVQAQETRAIQDAGVVLAHLDREIAWADAVLAQPLPEVTVDDERLDDAAAMPAAVGSRHGEGGGRTAHFEALQQRVERTRRIDAQARLAGKRKARAELEKAQRETQVRRETLLAERGCVLDQLADARELAREAFDARAARYTRARTGWRGLKRQEAHRVPGYAAAAAPAGSVRQFPVTAPTAPLLNQENR